MTQLFLCMIKAPEQTLALTLDPTSCDHLFLTMKPFGQDVPGTLLKAVGERETPTKRNPKALLLISYLYLHLTEMKLMFLLFD